MLVRQLIERGDLSFGNFSMSSVYRLLAAHGVDRESMAAGGFHPEGGPQKAFETALPNMLWMADMMYGPTLVTPQGKAVHARLFALLDDHSRLCPYAEYFASEGSDCFLAVLHAAVRARGVPDKIYTDNGKVFLCRHLHLVCANLGIKLSHARPYAAWSKGKIERFFRRVQSQFQTTLVFNPARDLADLNARFVTWLEGDYHQGVRYNPTELREVEIWHQQRFVQIAKPLDRRLNARVFARAPVPDHLTPPAAMPTCARPIAAQTDTPAIGDNP